VYFGRKRFSREWISRWCTFAVCHFSDGWGRDGSSKQNQQVVRQAVEEHAEGIGQVAVVAQSIGGQLALEFPVAILARDSSDAGPQTAVLDCRQFPSGQRRGRCPHELLDLRLPTTDWWQLLHMPLADLTRQLSTSEVAI
jgi:hypothetical protein